MSRNLGYFIVFGCIAYGVNSTILGGTEGGAQILSQSRRLYCRATVLVTSTNTGETCSITFFTFSGGASAALLSTRISFFCPQRTTECTYNLLFAPKGFSTQIVLVKWQKTIFFLSPHYDHAGNGCMHMLGFSRPRKEESC